MARRLVLGTAGHIDHGKTALVRALTGIETDRLPDEQKRGITIDIGFAHLDLPEARVGIVDVPGHERFIRNMLAGSSGIDLALLVVAADDSVMPQTREHLAILELLGIERGVMALTKCDLVEDEWLDVVEDDVRGLVAGTFLCEAPVVQTSVLSGAGVEELKCAIGALCGRVSRGEDDGPFRMAVDRSFALQGLGTVVTGTVCGGRVSVGDELELLCRGEKVRVRGLQSHGETVERIGRGQRAAINLQGVHHSEIVRGDELATPGLLRPARMLSVELRVLAESPWPVRHRSRVRLHIGTREVMASVRMLAGTTIEPGERGLVQLVCSEPVSAMHGQAFVVRSESPVATLGGGRVLQPNARPIRRKDDKARQRLALLRSDDEADRAAAAMWFCDAVAWQGDTWLREADMARGRTREVLHGLRERGELIDLGERDEAPLFMHRDRLALWRERIERVVGRYHELRPLEKVMPRKKLEQAMPRADAGLSGRIIDRLVADGVLAGDSDGVALSGFAPKLSEAQVKLRGAVLRRFEAAMFKPPDVDELVREIGSRAEEIGVIVELLGQEGEVVHVGGGMHLSRGAERELRDRVGGLLRSNGQMTMSEFRQVLETSRKYAVPLAEYLDRIGVTRRRGDVRVAAGRIG